MKALGKEDEVGRIVSRTEGRMVACPACGAVAAEPCRGVRGRPREANHAERLQLAERERESEALRRLAG